MTREKITADRAALAERLRGDANNIACDGIATSAPWSVQRFASLRSADLLAAAAELERPRPRVEWRRHATHEEDVRAVVVTPFGDFPVSLWWGDANAASERDRLLAAGFDVAPLPEVSDAG